MEYAWDTLEKFFYKNNLSFRSAWPKITHLLFKQDFIQIKEPANYIASKLSLSWKEIVAGFEIRVQLKKLIPTVILIASGIGLFWIIRRSYYYQSAKGSSKAFDEIRKQRTISLNLDSTSAMVQKPCVVCLENFRECVLIDCGHVCLCVDCFDKLPAPKKCPICNTKFSKAMPLFYP